MFGVPEAGRIFVCQAHDGSAIQIDIDGALHIKLMYSRWVQ
jgi:hypothetical protein